jgi:hypothetical protein
MAIPGIDGSGGFGGPFFAAFKKVYGPKRIERMAFTNRPFFKAIAKSDTFEGASYDHTIMYEDPQGGSATFSQAQAQAQASSQGARMVISRGREYQALIMDNEEIRASRSDVGSLLRKKTSETDRVIQEMCRRIDIALHNDGSGIVASFTNGNTVNGNTVALDVPALGIRFSVGMWIQFAASKPATGQATTLISPTAYQVTAVNRQSKLSTVTFAQPLAAMGVSGTNTQFFMVRAGCGLGFGTNLPTNGGVAGLKAWLPLTVPVAGDNFWGVDRSVDPQRLAGSIYKPAAGEKYEVTFQNASAELELQGSTADVVLMNPYNLNLYSQELGTKVRYFQDNPAVTGLNTGGGMIIRGQSGDLRAIADPQVDPGEFYMLDMSTWRLITLDGVPHLDTSDGLSALRQQQTDGIAMRWRAWYQPVCDLPGRNMHGTFGY